MERKNESVESKGRNVEEAIESGLIELGLSREDVEIEILNQGSRGVLGLGAEDARVVLTPIARSRITEEEEDDEEPEKLKKPARAMPAVEKTLVVEGGSEAGEAEISHEEIERIARDSLDTLLEYMSVEATVVTKEPSRFMAEGDNPPPVVLDIQGDDLGILIGRRAETLNALQYMVRLIVNHRIHRWYNIIIDVEGYKERRENQLNRLAQRMADQVLTTQKPVVLEAMPPYERRIIHLSLRDHPEVATHSIGEGDSRKVMIHLRQ